jgi:hypothetical protein
MAPSFRGLRLFSRQGREPGSEDVRQSAVPRLAAGFVVGFVKEAMTMI